MKTEIDTFDYIVSIDLGTTYSGSCYSYVRDNKRIVHVVKWPEQSLDDTFEKTPTACLYTNNDSPQQLIKWGKAALDYVTANPDDKNVLFVDQFKLKLHDIFEKHYQQKSQIDASNDIYVIAAIDYLREIHEYTCTQLIQQNSDTDPVPITKDRFRYVLTVPATWVNRDTSAMQTIAMKAGLIKQNEPLEKLIILNEAHAAALFCEREYCVTTDGERKSSKLCKGQRYLVCDAGGGTVDLSTYECTGTVNSSLLNNETLLKNEHCQLALESGGSCGSTILEHNMEKYLKEQVFFDCIEQVALKNLVNQFIKEIKHYFGGNEPDRNNYNSMDTDIHVIAKRTDSLSLNLPSNHTNVEVTTLNSKMKDVVEDDYDYNQDYDSDNEDKDMELNNTDDDMDMDEYDNDELFKIDSSDDDNEETVEQPLTVSDYIYFTLPHKGIDSSILENLSLKGDVIETNKVKQLRISHETIAKYIFDPIVDQVIHLIRKQIKKSHTTIDTLFLLGGFGQSPYLYKKLHQEFITNAHFINHLIVPENGYRASMRGGIYYGLDHADILYKNKMNQHNVAAYKSHKFLVSIDFNFIDLTAVFSIVKTRYLSMKLYNKIKDRYSSFATNSTDNIEEMPLFQHFVFDHDSFLQEYHHGNSTKKDDSSFYVKKLTFSFIKQLFQQVQLSFKKFYPQERWDPEKIRYCSSIACSSSPASNQVYGVDLGAENLFYEPSSSKSMNNNEILRSSNEILNSFMEDLYLCNNPITNFHSEQEKKVLSRHLFKAAEDIGMLNLNDGPERFLQTYQRSYGLFVAAHQQFLDSHRLMAATTQSLVTRLFNHLGIDASLRDNQALENNRVTKFYREQHEWSHTPSTALIYPAQTVDMCLFNLNSSNTLGKVIVMDCRHWISKTVHECEYPLQFNRLDSLPITGYWSHMNAEVFMERQQAIDRYSTNGTVENLLNYLVLESSPVPTKVFDYIKQHVDFSEPSEMHTMGDIWINPLTDQPYHIDFSVKTTIRRTTIYKSILDYAHTQVSTETILKHMIVPWIRFRLAPTISDLCLTHRRRKSRSKFQEMCLVFEGEIVETKNNGLSYLPHDDSIITTSMTAACFLFHVLKFELDRHFSSVPDEVPYCIDYDTHPDKTRHLSCLLSGVFYGHQSYQKSTRVSKNRYAVHFTKYASPPLTHVVVETAKSEKKKIFIEDQENNLILHSFIEKGQALSSDNKKEYRRDFYVTSECYLAAVLYSSEDEGSQEYYISNNSFKKMHRFIIPVKDISKPISIKYKIEKESILFTAHHDDYEADFRCNDFLMEIK